MEYTSKDRREWLKWHFENGENVSATSRRFGIPRSTLYRWLARYDPGRPSRPLRIRSSRPHTKPRTRTWGELELRIVAELNMRHPGFSAGRLAEVTQERHGLPFSRATIGRMLARIRRRCPTCSMRGGIMPPYTFLWPTCGG